jgi:hypothetical protein
MKSRIVVAILALGLATAQAGAQQLELGAVATGTASEVGAVFQFRASSAGLLTVVIRATAEGDLALTVGDEDGQPLAGGHSDQDLNGNAGAEQLVVTIPRAGAYTVRVRSWGEGGPFQIGASWLSFPALETPADPDGAPSRAIDLTTAQQSRQDALDHATGDYWDWFVITADRAGTLTVVTRAEEGDLALEAYQPGAYAYPAERSDADLQESGGNEALTLAVTAGQKLFFRVVDIGGFAPVSYRLQVSFMAD